MKVYISKREFKDIMLSSVERELKTKSSEDFGVKEYIMGNITESLLNIILEGKEEEMERHKRKLRVLLKNISSNNELINTFFYYKNTGILDKLKRITL